MGNLIEVKFIYSCMFQRSSLNLKCATLLGGKNCRWRINHFDLGSKSNGGKRVITSFGMSIRVFYWVHNRSGRSLIRLTPLANVPSCSYYPFPLSGDRYPHQRISRRRLPFSPQIDSQFAFPSVRSLAGGPDLAESDWANYRPHKENLQVDRPWRMWLVERSNQVPAHDSYDRDFWRHRGMVKGPEVMKGISCSEQARPIGRI